MTNGRFISVRHRALTYGKESRLSTSFFAGPPLQAKIGPLQAMVTTANQPRLYQTFTWSEYKNLAYSQRLEDSLLDMFRTGKGLEDP